MVDAKSFLEIRDEMESETIELLKEQLLDFAENDQLTEKETFKMAMIKQTLQDKMPYKETPRAYGQGDVRLGSTVEVGEDIFSLAFCSQINDKILAKHFDVIKGKLKEQEKAGEEEESTDTDRPFPVSINF